MDAFYERLLVRAATIDELLSGDFEPLAGQKGDVELAARRLAGWCRACASGDWSLFGRRLARDGWEIVPVLARLSSIRPKGGAPPWLADAVWIEAALQRPAAPVKGEPQESHEPHEPYAFEHLFLPLVNAAEARLWADVAAGVRDRLSAGAQACLRRALLAELSELCTPAVYEGFVKARKAAAAAGQPVQGPGTALYDKFIADMKAGGWRTLFEEKPVLLRLIALVARQWIDTAHEFLLRLDADLAAIRRDLLAGGGRVAKIEGDFSDPHNNGRSVKVVTFEDGARVVYKPKDLRLDAAWHALVERLNAASPPLDLKAVRTLARDGYGWTEFVVHAPCENDDGFARFFRRAGAWLALLHGFAATDMHQENMIACGEHPVPIDLETVLQAAADTHESQAPEDTAYNAATDIIANSVMTVGLLPAYGRGVDDNVFAVGGMTADWNAKIKITWHDINSDAMRPAKTREPGGSTPNLPNRQGSYARFADHVDDFIAGFEAYAEFLLRQTRGQDQGGLFDGFAGLPVRKVIRPTRFYYMLLQRLKNHRAMNDGAGWSAQADFIARLADWEQESDPLWPLQKAERAALLALNVPHFVTPSDGNEIRDETGIAIRSEAEAGLARARARVASLDADEIAWQTTVIGQNLSALARPAAPAPGNAALKQALLSEPPAAPEPQFFAAEAGRIAEELAGYAIRRDGSAAWIGLDWLGDAEVFQLTCLGHELYNGVSGIALFLAAHAAVSGEASSRAWGRAALAHLRKEQKSRNAARMARSLGIGGATGLGSIVYALTVIAGFLDDDALRADALSAAALFTDDLIAADKQLDVMGGSAGAIIALLRLYRDSHAPEALAWAEKCGAHILRQPRIGEQGRRAFATPGAGPHGLNGMSHGAAGFAYALSALAAATGREHFAQAASECIAFEDASYDAERHNWPDLRGEGALAWPCQWCHGAPGIGLARIATARRGGGLDRKLLAADIGNALTGAQDGWPGPVDTLCCGTLGSIEFFCEAAGALERGDLGALAARRLAQLLQASRTAGDFRWNSGQRRFNLGLFRGLAGVGYTALRRVDPSLPDVLIWE
ncbi:MAG: type 2 lanthipeptide synthetase LanM family protein [Pseudolabrys sp.]